MAADIKPGSRGYLNYYRRLGYAHGKAKEHTSPTSCLNCEGKFYSTDREEDRCSCGCLDEYGAAKWYAEGKCYPMSVSVEDGGYVTAGGDFVPHHTLESRDAWDFRSALKAARYLADGLGHYAWRNARLHLSYTSRDPRA